MANVSPFRALRYAPPPGDSMDNLISPPYDVISPGRKAALRRLSPHNSVRLTLPEDGEQADFHANAARTLSEWRTRGILAPDAAPSFYFYEQEFEMAGKRLSRTALLCRLLIEEFGRGDVYPHEETFGGPKADRAALTLACKTNLSPVFGLFMDPDGAIDRAFLDALKGAQRVIDATDDESVRHRLWMRSDAEVANSLKKLLAPQKLFIADGHHRYEASLAVRDKLRSPGAPRGQDPSDWVMTACVSSKNPGLKILPTHRLVSFPQGVDVGALIKAVESDFDVSKSGVEYDDIARELENDDPMPRAIIYAGKSRGAYVAELRRLASMKRAFPERSDAWRALDPSALHALILESVGIPFRRPDSNGRVEFLKDPLQAMRAVDENDGMIAFLLRAAKVESLEKVSLAGERMPHKSTYFHPKFATGMAFYSREDNLTNLRK